MKTRFTSTTLLAAVTALGLGAAPAFANTPSANSGYEFTDFWGNVAAQQAPSAPPAANTANGPAIHNYITQTSHGTWLFPPHQNEGTNG